MTSREESIGTVEHLPDDVVQAILALLKPWQRQTVSENELSGLHEANEPKTVLERMGGEPKHMLSVGGLSDRDRRREVISKHLQQKYGHR
ncbi:MAG: hypothetical protein AAFR12_22590 [Cyanobacteria bacterium J06626_6]